MKEILRVENLHKNFGSNEVLRGIDLTVQEGETVVLIGSSGSGKSTLLRCLNFLEYPSAGKIYLSGQLVGKSSGVSADKETVAYRETELCKVRTHVGMVFQQFNLFPHLTVEANVMIGPMKILGLSKAEAAERARANLKQVGIEAKAREYPSRLSGGQQQRVAIARALAMEPTVMLFDEATSALDPELVGEVLLVMRELSRQRVTMLVVTHELGFAYNAADKVIFLHQGMIHESGPPSEVLVRPKQVRTQEFLRGFHLFRMPSMDEPEKSPSNLN
jgi:polar amino acid transport system ATP-binding protein